MHNKSVYEVNYLYGIVNKLTSNITAENTLSQIYSESCQYQLLIEVNYHNIYDISIAKVDVFIKYSNGKLHRKRKNCLYKILVGWRDVSVYSITIKDLKQSNPVELSEYSLVNEKVMNLTSEGGLRRLCAYMKSIIFMELLIN